MTGGTGTAARPPAGAEADVWTVLRMMQWSGEYLQEKGIERGRLDAEHLLADVLGVKRLELYLQFDRPLVAEELDAYRPLLRRRAKREPLQYILGHAGFRELVLSVDDAVLIPRPETESLVQEVLAWCEARVRPPRAALDLGTGSGAIALSLAMEGDFEQVVATDYSPDALAVARRNASSSGVESVEFREGSFFAPLAEGEMFDVIVSNPPYVAESEADELQLEVMEWEPKGALFAGPDGLGALREITGRAADHLSGGGLLALEVGLGQAGPVVGMLEDTGAYDEVRVRRDLTDRERMVLAVRS